MKTADGEAMTLDLDHLPDDPALLHQLILDLLSTNENLRHQLKQLQRYQFGSKSERFEALEEQKLLFEQLRNLMDDSEEKAETDEEEALEATAEENGKKKGHGRKPFPEHLPRERVEFPLSEEKRDCPNCAGHLEKIGEEVTKQLEYIPASFHVRELVRFKYACKQCQEGVVTSELPPQPIEKGIPGPGLLAHVLTSKYCDHLPLNRLEGIFQRNGIEISRKTTCDWVGKSAALLEPLVAEMKKELKASKKIHSDDTVVPVLEKDRKTTKQGRLWVYGNDAHIVYDYTPNRSREGPKAFLKGYRGYLQADAYAGYNELIGKKKATLVGCWAHARRKFVEAKDSDPLRSHTALVFIGDLYRIEKEWRMVESETRAAARRSQALPILEKFEAWLREEAGRVLPKSPMGQAIRYTLNQWDSLVRYVEEGDLDIDNNFAERAMRCVVIGRKNWMFAGSDSGGTRAAIIYSLVATCKLHGIDPFEYFRDVLGRLPSHPINHIHELLPHNWKAAHTDSSH
ncbi:MAG: IS66 family transposase [Candidatus Omnitrophica bacterium]|nr:IS66 family transposase [Candidatus Omnitrophota bacterium]MCA9417471.1 IS66 family transposase [Candidatus Omnitrophota bacterium]